MLSSGWCKGLLIFCGVITGCYFCCCCFCFCCNFCCGRYKHVVEEEEPDYEDLEQSEDSKSEDSAIIGQPGTDKNDASGGEAKTFAMPPPSYDSINTPENTNSVITEQPQPQTQTNGETIVPPP